MGNSGISFIGFISDVQERVAKNKKKYILSVIRDVESGIDYRVMYWSESIKKYLPTINKGGIFIIEKPDEKYGTSCIKNFVELN